MIVSDEREKKTSITLYINKVRYDKNNSSKYVFSFRVFLIRKEREREIEK